MTSIAGFTISFAWFIPSLAGHNVSFLQPALLVLAAGCLVVGLTIGTLSRLLPFIETWLLAFLIVIFADFYWVDFSVKGPIIVATLAIGAVLYPLRRNAAQILAVVFGVISLTSIVKPSHPTVLQTGSMPARESTLPPYVHIILDEHIGRMGVPRDGRALLDSLTQTYKNRGFSVFEGALSHFYRTNEAITHLVNFTEGQKKLTYYKANKFSVGDSPTQNTYFDYLTAKGYALNVHSTDFVNLCRWGDEGTAAKCTISQNESLAGLSRANIGAFNKALALYAGATRKPYLLSRWNKLFRRWIHVGKIGRQSMLNGLDAWAAFSADVKTIQPGEAFIFHSILPHYPYVLKEDCSVDEDFDVWSEGGESVTQPHKNTAESRQRKYSLYYRQIKCVHHLLEGTLESIPKTATVIIHGDHGSRITLNYPNGKHIKAFGRQEILDTFSTFFVARVPGIPATIDRKPKTLPKILANLIGKDIQISETRGYLNAWGKNYRGVSFAPIK